MIKGIKHHFMRGLIALIPIVITLGLLFWLYNLIEGNFARLLIYILGEERYFPGLSLVLTVLIILAFGILINHWFVGALYQKFENLLKKMPLIKTLYSSVQDLMSLFRGKGERQSKAVVLVHIGETKILGLVTRDDFGGLPKGLGSADEIAVFLPMSYQIGGMTVIVPKSAITPIDFSVEEGLRFSITAGMPGLAKKTFEENTHMEQQAK